MSRILFLCCFGLFSICAHAQVANDECAQAIALPELVDYCSGRDAFTNAGSTQSLTDFNDYPICYDEKADVTDVWFTFVALRDAATVSVRGATGSDAGGTLRAPQFAVYETGCANLEERPIGCRSPFEDAGGNVLNGGSIILTELTAGATYTINVTARFGNTGSFELCVNQFDNVPTPSADCATGVILCDKSAFAVDFLQGTGTMEDDLGVRFANCGNRGVDESNSAWYRWTCERSGTLAFTIDPLGAAINEDIDFVIYDLGPSLDGCGDKTPLREMFSGETTGAGDANLPCFDETGLSLSDSDQFEDCGCSEGDNNFVQAIDMVAGRNYALVVMNFSGSGAGFEIEFGGTGTFVGPTADIRNTTTQACVGEAITFEDNSTSLDGIVSYEWNFGPTANPRTAEGAGPHEVVFGQPGNPQVELVIQTTRDCREVARSQSVEIICCEGQFTGSGDVTNLTCPADSSGSIDLTAASGFSPTTLTYAWSNGEMTEDIGTLDVGTYTVTLSDESTCTEELAFTVGGPAAFTFDTLITMPSCGGQADGSFEFTVTGGGEGPYEYSLNGSPFSGDNRLDDIPVSVVAVSIRDANGCLESQSITVDELELGLVPGSQVFTEPVCNGEANGTIGLDIANGTPNYEYDFGGGFQADSTTGGLAAGTYTVTARDATGCLGVFDVTIPEPPAIDLSLEGTGSTCFGTDDGMIAISAEGGRPGYTLSFVGGRVLDSTFQEGLLPGSYTVQLVDQNGCTRRATTVLTQPNEIFPRLVAAEDLLCFGDSTGSFALDATGGTPGYTFSSDGENFQQDSVLADLLAGDYTLYVMDANGCTDSLAGALTQPREFIIDPGTEGSIFLGFDTTLRVVSNYTPVSYEWGPDSLACLDPLCTRVRAQPFITTDYLVVGTNDAGCTDTAAFKLNVIDDRPFYVPTGFSPNGDGFNDGFTIFGGRAVRNISRLQVYDRWGGLMYERENFAANDPSLGWDGEVGGKKANSAVYVYYATINFVNDQTVTVSGDITLVR